MRKVIAVTTLALLLTLGVTPHVSADAPEGKLTDTEQQQVSQNCRQAQVNLHALQQRDTVLRINRGRLYEMTLKQTDAFVARLGANHIDPDKLSSINTTLHTQVQYFENDYNTYANDLDDALASDCTAQPQQFYDSLQKAVEERKIVGHDVALIQGTLGDYSETIAAVRDKAYPSEGNK